LHVILHIILYNYWYLCTKSVSDFLQIISETLSVMLSPRLGSICMTCLLYRLFTFSQGDSPFKIDNYSSQHRPFLSVPFLSFSFLSFPFLFFSFLPFLFLFIWCMLKGVGIAHNSLLKKTNGLVLCANYWCKNGSLTCWFDFDLFFDQSARATLTLYII